MHEQSIIEKRQKINDTLQEAAATAAAAAAAAMAAATAAAVAATKIQKQAAKLQTGLFQDQREASTLRYLLEHLDDVEQEEKLQDIDTTM